MVEERKFLELIFALGHTGDMKETTLTVTQQEVYNHPPFGYTSRVHLVVKGTNYTVNVLGNNLQSGLLQSESDVHELCDMSNRSSYKFILVSTVNIMKLMTMKSFGTI